MDWISVSSKWMDYIKKYRYVALVLLAGLVLMALPEGEDAQENTMQAKEETVCQENLEDALSQILSQIEGAGKVKVLLTEAAGEEILYQTDQDISQSEQGRDDRRETVLVTDTQRSQEGLIRQVNPPQYQGAIVLCQGAGSPAVKLSIAEAVSDATGLTFDRITVLKMK